MTPEQQKATVEQTIQKSMDENKKAMEQQGLEGAPPGVGFQPPESMKKYMNKQGGGAGTSAPGGGTGTSAPPSGGGAGSEQKKD